MTTSLIEMLEAATRGVLCKKVFLEISQNSQESICARASFLIKLQAYNFIKKETLVQVFSCEFCEISINTFSTEHLQKTTSKMLELPNFGHYYYVITFISKYPYFKKV